ncbi:MAG: hypothetical protein KJ568_05325 [Actinobacteria bacterium]|nr:hypothetical protein [Actinomycetota bacterium]
MKLEKELRKVEEIEYKSKLDPFTEYVDTFIQRLPRYTVKVKNWKTKKKPLSDTPIKAHLNGQYYVGVLGKWYPEYSILDIDNVTIEEAERIRDELGLDTENSMLCSSENSGSYHILIRPSYNNRPPTIRLLQDTFKLFGKQNKIEIYPQANRTIRLPFGHRQNCLDFEYIDLKDWKEKLNWFLKLDDFNLSDIPYQQPELDLTYENPGRPDVFQEGGYLLQNGLQIKNSRHEAQFKMLYNLWRRNIPYSQAINIIWQTIKNKHNGFSRDIINNPGIVEQEIIRQAGRIYDTYEHTYIYPDETHNGHNGYISKADIPDIVRLSKANLPRMRFLYSLVKYCYPRKDRRFVNVHSDKLKEWSIHNYLKYLDELIKLEIVKRGDAYQIDKFSKSINIKWNFRDSSNAILDDNRAPDTLENTIRLSYAPEEFKELLKGAGSERHTAIKTVERIYKG